MSNLKLNEKLNNKSELFTKNINSKMVYQSEFSSTSLDFSWVELIEKACPYIDNIVTNPKVSLIKEEDVVKVEKAKKISVASVKDLSKNTHYIEKIDAITSEVQPSKLLIERTEETYNTYENRVLYTLIYNLSRFVMQKEKEMEDMEVRDEKTLEYAGTTNNGVERLNIELKVTANQLPNIDFEGSNAQSLEEKLKEVYEKIELINRFIMVWQRSALYTSLRDANVSLVFPPLRRTNLILKNPNFQMAMKVWDFLQSYQDIDDEKKEESLDSTGNAILKSILDDAFLMNYYVMDSITPFKRDQKKRITEYAIIMMHQQIKRVIATLLSNGITITEEEILSIIAEELKKEKDQTEINEALIKDKFRTAIDEYLDKAQNYF